MCRSFQITDWQCALDWDENKYHFQLVNEGKVSVNVWDMFLCVHMFTRTAFEES